MARKAATTDTAIKIRVCMKAEATMAHDPPSAEMNTTTAPTIDDGGVEVQPNTTEQNLLTAFSQMPA